MTVLFDEDYLIAGAGTQTSSATFFLLDQDGAQQNNGDTPLMHSVDADGRVDAAGETTVFTDSIGISFTLDGAPVEASLTQEQIDAAVASASYDFDAFVADLNENGTLPAGVTVEVDATTQRITFLDNGEAYFVPAIIVTSENGGAFGDLSFVSQNATGVEYNEFGRFFDNADETSGRVEVAVELEKVGRNGDGGDLIIGGMEDAGIQVFNVEVQGRADQPSSLASLASTNNTLETINIVSEAGSLASLEIGNGNTEGTEDFAFAASDTESFGNTASSVMNNAVVDVRDIDASAFDNGLTIHASVTDASVAKYMDLGDTQADPSADNANFVYQSGAGNDTWNVNISESNLAFSGTANREDFSMSIASGAGDDSITMQIGDGMMTDAGLANHRLMDANADSRIGVDAGDGDDMVHTNGDSIFRVDLGAGNDVAYTDNSGVDAGIFNDGRGTFVLNALADWNDDADDGTTPEVHNIDDLQSDTNDSYILLGTTLSVNFLGYTATADITSYTTTDLQINNMIKDIIQNDEHLSDVIVAEDGPGNTLVVRSLIDGEMVDEDFSVAVLQGDEAFYTGLSVAQITLFNSVTGEAAADGAAVQNIVDAAVTTFGNAEDYAGVIAYEDQEGSVLLAGVGSAAITENTTTDGTGNDTIVLSTGADSAETVVLVADGQTDVIFNFGADDTIQYGVIDSAASIELVIGADDVTADDSASVAAFIEYFNTDGSVAADGAVEGDNLFTITDGDGANVTNFVVSVDDEGVATAGLDYGMLILAEDLTVT
jgi:hypothetical protein